MHARLNKMQRSMIFFAGAFFVCSNAAQAQKHTVLAHLWIYDHSKAESDAYVQCLESTSPMFNSTRSASIQGSQVTSILCNDAKESVVKKVIAETHEFLTMRDAEVEAGIYISAISGCTLGKISIESAPVCRVIQINRQ